VRDGGAIELTIFVYRDKLFNLFILFVLEKTMGDKFEKVKLAAVQASPVFLNREATVDKACKLIKEAGEAGANFVGFPESFIPGHPVWYLFEISAAGSRAMDLATELYKNSVVIPSPDTDKLCAAAQEAGVYVVIGLCEKKADQTGTMYNTQLFIGPNGQILGKHQKLVPTLTEKMVHTGGSGRYLRTFPTEYGPVSGMICGENTNPLGVAVMASEYTRIHVASWPHHFMPGHWASMHQSIEIASRNVAYACKAFGIYHYRSDGEHYRRSAQRRCRRHPVCGRRP
jgi:nitrilase